MFSGPDIDVSRKMALAAIGLPAVASCMLKFRSQTIRLPRIIVIVILGILACVTARLMTFGSRVIVVLKPPALVRVLMGVVTSALVMRLVSSSACTTAVILLRLVGCT